MTTNQRLYGSEAPLPTYTELNAGPLTIGYEDGAFRYFRWGEHEIIRMVYVSLRDENWGTLAPIRSNEEWVIEDDQFQIRYDCRYERDSAVLFSWQVTAEGTADGAFTMTIDGLAHQNFLRNRAGFCILHPIQTTAGQPCQLFHPDGQWETTHFPKHISPQNPFREVVGMRWQPVEAVWFRLDMSGDVFETEDQRNWTDASYKTFCTPSSLPIPVQLRAGDRVQQRIQFRPEQPLTILATPAQNDVIVRVFEQERTGLPALGVGASTEIRVLTEPAIQELQRCLFTHYRIEVIPAQEGWEAGFLADVANAQVVNLPLLTALQVSDNHVAELEEFLLVMQQNEVVLSDLILFSINKPVMADDVVRTAIETVRNVLPKTRIGAGTNYNFTELNRNRITTTGLDFISYGIHPQEHAFDNRSLVETLNAQGDTVRTAKSFAGSVPVHVSPVTLRRRSNPYAHEPGGRSQTNEQKADPRQSSLWAAGWTLGSMKYLAEAGAESITYYQTVGHQGVIASDGQVYPLCELLTAIQALRGGQVIYTETSQPLACCTLLLVSGNRRCWLLANHTDKLLSVILPEPVQSGYRITPVPVGKIPLDLGTDHRLTIEPYGVWVLDC